MAVQTPTLMKRAGIQTLGPGSGVLSVPTVDSPINSEPSCCTGFALVASGYRPQFADTSADEHDDACLLAGDKTTPPSVTSRRREAEERAEYHFENGTFIHKSVFWRSAFSLELQE